MFSLRFDSLLIVTKRQVIELEALVPISFIDKVTVNRALAMVKLIP
jgi:hypothetical protein